MAKPPLFLSIEQGPKSGCRVECKPASIATVGRARANALQITRDPGISQRHVCFQWRDDGNHVGWMAMDMGSSNGTIINNKHTTPHEWVCLKHGDVIKIGAETSIRIKLVGFSDNELQTAPKRSKMRSTRATVESHGKALAEDVKFTCALAESHGKAVAEEDDGRMASASIQSKLPKIETVDTTPSDIDMSMTVEQWFQHMMDEGPKYLYRVSEEIIQDILRESKLFDEYMMSLP